jgi:hypothetical protein
MSYACMVRLPDFDDEMRRRIAAEGITETFIETNAEPDSAEPVDSVRLLVPAENEAQADVALMRAFRGLDYERISNWGIVP